MRALDKSKRYNLEYLTGDEKEHVFNYLKYCSDWKDFNVYDFEKELYKGIYFDKEVNFWIMTNDDLNTNAKELFYTLENIQVDCRELSDEQIKEMADVFEKAGYNYYDNDMKYALKVGIDNRFFMIVSEYSDKFIIVDGIDTEKNTITYEKFMELFGNKEKSQEFKNLVEVLNEELTEKAYKETVNKLNYELDFNFITQLAERMAQNKHKYEPYNWQKLDNIDELKQALFRHVLEVMKGNYEDDSRLFGHLESIALNCMFINYQLNKQSEK